ncbi:MAG: hypothetical protein V5783_11220 [Pontiella sp.]
MQKLTVSVALFTIILIAAGCVNRTTSREPSRHGLSPKSENYGATGHGEVIEQKRIWIWEKEFRNR